MSEKAQWVSKPLPEDYQSSTTAGGGSQTSWVIERLFSELLCGMFIYIVWVNATVIGLIQMLTDWSIDRQLKVSHENQAEDSGRKDRVWGVVNWWREKQAEHAVIKCCYAGEGKWKI